MAQKVFVLAVPLAWTALVPGINQGAPLLKDQVSWVLFLTFPIRTVTAFFSLHNVLIALLCFAFCQSSVIL